LSISLKESFSSFATGVAVVSASTPRGPIGNTVSSFNTVSMEPPLVLFSLKRAARSFEAWQSADAFAVNVLSSEQADLSRRFARQSLGKWDGVATRVGPCVGAPVIELHTGAFANAWKSPTADSELERLRVACEHAHRLGLIVNAGHGINYDNIRTILTLPHLNELNIGHSIVARALFTGIRSSVAEMKAYLTKKA